MFFVGKRCEFNGKLRRVAFAGCANCRIPKKITDANGAARQVRHHRFELAIFHATIVASAGRGNYRRHPRT